MAKFTDIGLYVKPDTSRLPAGMNASDAKAYLKVFLNKKGPQSITVGSGDIFVFTTKSQKLAELKKVFEAGKIKEETFNTLTEIYGADHVIAAVSLKQAE